jgi:hypothetical protein
MLPNNINGNVGVTVLLAGIPTADLLVECELVMSAKNNYSFLYGPSNEVGRVPINVVDVLSRAQIEMNAFPMDYVGTDAGFTGEIRIYGTPLKRLNAALRAFRIFGSEFPSLYPDNFEAIVNKSLDVLQGHANEAISVSFELSNPTGIYLRTCEVRA